MQCYPALVGHSTPVGEFDVVERLTEKYGYGGNVLQFHETDTIIYAIHRTWLLNPEQHRDLRIQSKNVKDRFITKGCVNVQPEVFEQLKTCCINEKLTITTD